MRPWEKKEIDEAVIEIDPMSRRNYHMREGGDDRYRKDLRDEVRDLNEVFGDHKSLAGYRATINLNERILCIHCGLDPEEDAEGPYCCDAAVAGYQNCARLGEEVARGLRVADPLGAFHRMVRGDLIGES